MDNVVTFLFATDSHGCNARKKETEEEERQIASVIWDESHTAGELAKGSLSGQLCHVPARVKRVFFGCLTEGKCISIRLFFLCLSANCDNEFLESL